MPFFRRARIYPSRAKCSTHKRESSTSAAVGPRRVAYLNSVFFHSCPPRINGADCTVLIHSKELTIAVTGREQRSFFRLCHSSLQSLFIVCKLETRARRFYAPAKCMILDRFPPSSLRPCRPDAIPHAHFFMRPIKLTVNIIAGSNNRSRRMLAIQTPTLRMRALVW